LLSHGFEFHLSLTVTRHVSMAPYFASYVYFDLELYIDSG